MTFDFKNSYSQTFSTVAKGQVFLQSGCYYWKINSNSAICIGHGKRRSKRIF